MPPEIRRLLDRMLYELSPRTEEVVRDGRQRFGKCECCGNEPHHSTNGACDFRFKANVAADDVRAVIKHLEAALLALPTDRPSMEEVLCPACAKTWECPIVDEAPADLPQPEEPPSRWTKNDVGDMVCEHGTTADVHCCNCHGGFLFDSDSCVCVLEAPTNPPNLPDAAEMLWVVLANVSGGDWTKQLPEWQEAAARWRDYYFQSLPKVRPADLPPPEEGEKLMLNSYGRRCYDAGYASGRKASATADLPTGEAPQ